MNQVEDKSTLFISDIHLGVSRANFELVKKAFGEFHNFSSSQGILVGKVVDLGDTTECWLPREGDRNTYAAHKNPEAVGALRHMYDSIFGNRPKIVEACAGNHQTVIHPEGSSDHELLCESEKAVTELRNLMRRVLDPDKDSLSIFRGVKEVEGGVLAHHGDLLNAQRSLRRMLAELTTPDGKALSLDKKLALINEDAGAYGEMQGIWRSFKRNLWPVLDTLKYLPGATDFFFKWVMVTPKKLRALAREGKSGRSMSEKWQNPLSDFAALQFEMMDALLPDHPNPLIVSGHTHIPGIISNIHDHKGTAVSLGAWTDCHEAPVVGLKNEKSFSLLRFHPHKGWSVRDKVSV